MWSQTNLSKLIRDTSTQTSELVHQVMDNITSFEYTFDNIITNLFSSPLLTYLTEGNTSLAVTFQFAYAYLVRACLIWTALAWSLIVYRHLIRSIADFSADEYADTFRAAMIVFAALYFPGFLAVYLVYVAIVRPIFRCVSREPHRPEPQYLYPPTPPTMYSDLEYSNSPLMMYSDLECLTSSPTMQSEFEYSDSPETMEAETMDTETMEEECEFSDSSSETAWSVSRF
ncbi:hypothetical protein F4802DRAFT_118925 [Xylaria palmicola]|nr:hypothetical protein F4802DRAFT_118925 [Xylaria palmicola]